MRTRTTRILSSTLGLLSLTALLYVDYEIAAAYDHAEGKTKALFGIFELLRFNYRYLILIPAILSILLALRPIRTKEFSYWDIGTLLLGLISVIGVLTPSWRLMTLGES